MATFTATRAASTFPVYKTSGSGALGVAYGTYTIAANPADGDIYEMCRVPAGATIVGGYFYGADLDTGTETLDIDIGWAANGAEAADPDGLGNLGVLTGDAFAAGNVSNVAGLVYPLTGVLATGVLPSFTRETVIQLEANAAANSGGTGVVSLVVFYVVS